MKQNEIFEELFERYPSLACAREDILSAFELLCECFDRGGKLLLCGNGGSAADCDHIVGELLKGFLSRRPLSAAEKAPFDEVEGGAALAEKLQGALPAVSLCAHSALLSAFANDVDPTAVFAQQVFALGVPYRDALIALSTSGNSENIVSAAVAARALSVASIAITGEKPSRLEALCDVCIRLPETETFKVQELTLPVYHCLCAMLEARYFS